MVNKNFEVFNANYIRLVKYLPHKVAYKLAVYKANKEVAA